MRFARTRIALHQQARGEQFFNIDTHICPVRVLTYDNMRIHCCGISGWLAEAQEWSGGFCPIGWLGVWIGVWNGSFARLLCWERNFC